MRNALPVLTVVGVIIVIWYIAAIWMNSTWALQMAERLGREMGFTDLVVATMTQDRPLVAAPHQVVVALWDGVFGHAVTSKRSFVYHGFVTLEATLWGFALGIVIGVGLAIAIVHSRAVDMSVMPWAVISQTVPIVALAPMIVVVANAVGVEDRLLPKAIISAYLSFFPVLVSMVSGLRAPNQMQLDLLKTYGANRSQVFWKLRLPASLPYFFASLKVAIAASLIGAIVGELPTGAINGLGARMLIGSQFGQPLIMWAALFGAAILAGILIIVVGAIQRAADRRMGVAR
ncbi:ABC transporter permease [Roseovarius sp. TE539]|uniref:ABC transporter permease n=1 Tax=Roseovarius sp. TE539 TaxID=2249812 RepID=UPI000DDCBA44|nr:ABC transporter permease [Roseovarius sp. TE539]RBI71469.1 ABC transporter permease [Roseovarius sp. TE539]